MSSVALDDIKAKGEGCMPCAELCASGQRVKRDLHARARTIARKRTLM